MAHNFDVQELPRPRPSKGNSAKVIVLAMLAVAMLAGASYWLTRDEAEKEALKARVAEAVKDTPLATVTKFFIPPPPPSPKVTQPATQPGTLAGPVVQGTVPKTLDIPGDVSETPVAPPPIAPKVEEDNVVRMLFVEDLAQWLVVRYVPGRDGGSVTWSLSALNLRYGGFTYRGEDVLAGRASLLRYVFNTPMLTALYALYVDRFVEALEQAAREPAQGRPLTSEQTDEMFKAYAGRFAALGGVMQGVTALSDFAGRMSTMTKISQQITGVQSQMTEAVFALDEAREAGAATRMEAAQLRINGLNAQYQRLVADRHAVQQQMMNAIRQAAPAARGVDEDTIMFVAAWVERRLNHDPQSAQAVMTAARLLDDLSLRLRKAGSIAR